MKVPKLQYDKKEFSKLVKERIKNDEDSEVAQNLEDFVGKLLGGEVANFFSEEFIPDESNLQLAKEILQENFEGMVEEMVWSQTEDVDWDQFPSWNVYKTESLKEMKAFLEDGSYTQHEFEQYSPDLEKYLIQMLKEEWDSHFSSNED